MAKIASVKKLTKNLLKELRGGASTDTVKGAVEAKRKGKPAAKPLTAGQVKKLDPTGSADSKTKNTSNKFTFSCNTTCYEPDDKTNPKKITE